jgi:hypothetical protein
MQNWPNDPAALVLSSVQKNGADWSLGRGPGGPSHRVNAFPKT